MELGSRSMSVRVRYLPSDLLYRGVIRKQRAAWVDLVASLLWQLSPEIGMMGSLLGWLSKKLPLFCFREKEASKALGTRY